MGKQINFVFDNLHETIFLDYIFKSYMVYSDEDNVIQIVRDPGFLLSNEVYSVYLTKYAADELVIKQLSQGKEYIDSLKSAVIELARPSVDDNSKTLTMGRLWVQMKYFNDDGTLVYKDMVLDKWYKEISGWIKKNLKRYKLNDKNGIIFNDYMSDSVAVLIEKEGYVLSQ